MDTRTIAAIRRMIASGASDESISVALDAFGGQPVPAALSAHVNPIAADESTDEPASRRRVVRNGITVYDAAVTKRIFDKLDLTEAQRIVGAYVLDNGGKTTRQIAKAVGKQLGWSKRDDDGVKPLQSLIYQLRHTDPPMLESREAE